MEFHDGPPELKNGYSCTSQEYARQADWDLSPVSDRIALCRVTHGFRKARLFER